MLLPMRQTSLFKTEPFTQMRFPNQQTSQPVVFSKADRYVCVRSCAYPVCVCVFVCACLCVRDTVCVFESAWVSRFTSSHVVRYRRVKVHSLSTDAFF